MLPNNELIITYEFDILSISVYIYLDIQLNKYYIREDTTIIFIAEKKMILVLGLVGGGMLQIPNTIIPSISTLMYIHKYDNDVPLPRNSLLIFIRFAVGRNSHSISLKNIWK